MCIRDRAEALNEETATALANERFARLFEALRDAGLGPSGGFWTTLRAGEQGAGDAGTIEIVCCWPTAVAVDPGWGGPDTVVGMLPARTELVATWRPGDDEEPLGSTTHPAVVALFDAIAERDAVRALGLL